MSHPDERAAHITFDPATQNTLSKYVVDLFVKQTAAQIAITTSTKEKGLPQIDLRPEEGWMLYLLTRMIGARRAVEFGTLAGYSASWIARGLAPGGTLITFESSEEHAAVARENLAAAGFADVVEVRVGEAKQLVQALEGPFDLAFLDADKTGYETYLNWALSNIRPGGLIVAHNAFQGGAIAETTNVTEKLAAMQRFNQRAAEHESLLSTIIPVGDGLLVALVQ
ncbi:MAG: O-methyltransferase [Chloroflexi bacterium]|nr:O-methyltransferase [Chloroflexota bacterium]